MAKREKYADLVTRAAALDLRAHILEIATTDYPDALYRHRTGTDVYLWRAFRLPCAAGGYVVCICAPAGSTTNARHLGRGAFSFRRVFFAERLDQLIGAVRDRWNARAWAEMGAAQAIAVFERKRAELLGLAAADVAPAAPAAAPDLGSAAYEAES